MKQTKFFKPYAKPGKVAQYELNLYDKTVVVAFQNVETSLVPDDFTF